MEPIMEELRHGLEEVVAEIRANRQSAHADKSWVRVQGSNESNISRFDVLQTYLLLQILDKLESIDGILACIGNDTWNDHHNK